MLRENPYRRERIVDVIHHAATDFIKVESSKTSMITVTRVELADDFQKADIFVTVFPEQEEEKALAFLKRNLHEFKNFVKEKTRLQQIPWFNFVLDLGDKSRRRIDELSHDL